MMHIIWDTTEERYHLNKALAHSVENYFYPKKYLVDTLVIPVIWSTKHHFMRPRGPPRKIAQVTKTIIAISKNTLLFFILI